MEQTAYTLQGATCLVIGYGRIGALRAHKLHALDAAVTVSARSPRDLPASRPMGCVARHPPPGRAARPAFQPYFQHRTRAGARRGGAPAFPPGLPCDRSCFPARRDFAGCRASGPAARCCTHSPSRAGRAAVAARAIHDTVLHHFAGGGRAMTAPLRIGFALTGSFCTFAKGDGVIRALCGAGLRGHADSFFHAA